MGIESYKMVAEQVLLRFPVRFRAEHVDLATPGFSGAVIARLNCAAGEFCLRGWPPDAMPEQRLLGLHGLLRHVHGQGVVAVSVPVTANDGSTLVFLHNRVWQLEPWMPGTADFHRNPSEIRLQAAMRCLAAWHHAAVSYNPLTEETTWFASCSGVPSPAVQERLERIDYLLSHRCLLYEANLRRSNHTEFQRIGLRILELFRRAAPYVTGQLKAAAQSEFALQPCLRDIWHDHVLYTGDNVTGVVDASACRSENVATDLARLLGSFVSDEQNMWDFAIQEYQRHRRLTPDELTLIFVLDGSAVLLSGMTWLERVFVTGQSISGDGRILSRLQIILSRLEHLARTLSRYS